MISPPGKPYVIIELPENVRRKRIKDIPGMKKGHSIYLKNAFSGTIFASIFHVTPCYVGTGLFDVQNNNVIKSTMKRQETPVIPGSTLKGVFRHIFEAITDSCIHRTNIKTKNRSKDYQTCGQPNSIKAHHNKTDYKLCPACAVFGTWGIRSRIGFTDATPHKKNPVTKSFLTRPLYSPQPKCAFYHDKSGNISGRKFYFHSSLAKGKLRIECIPPGDNYIFKILFRNLTAGELYALILACGLTTGEKRIYPKIGGCKPLGFGSAKINILKLSYMNGYGNQTVINTINNYNSFLDQIKRKNNDIVINENVLRNLIDLHQDIFKLNAPVADPY